MMFAQEYSLTMPAKKRTQDEPETEKKRISKKKKQETKEDDEDLATRLMCEELENPTLKEGPQGSDSEGEGAKEEKLSQDGSDLGPTTKLEKQETQPHTDPPGATLPLPSSATESVTINGRCFPLPFDDPCCDIAPIATAQELMEHFAKAEHISNVEKCIAKAASDPEGPLSPDVEEALLATCFRKPERTWRDRLQALAKASPLVSRSGAGLGAVASVAPGAAPGVLETSAPSPGRGPNSRLTSTLATGGRPQATVSPHATRRAVAAAAMPPPSPKEVKRDDYDFTPRRGQPFEDAARGNSTMTLQEAKQGVEMLLYSAPTLSSSAEDENQEVYVLTLARLVHHGRNVENISMPAVCDICRRHGEPADLSNDHTLRKHLSGRTHKKRLKDELVRIDRALAESSSSEHSGSSSRSGSSTGYSSSSDSRGMKQDHRGSYKSSLGPAPDYKRIAKPAPTTPTYNAFGQPARREENLVTFGCVNLACRAKCSAPEWDVKTKCGKCGLEQAVTHPAGYVRSNMRR